MMTGNIKGYFAKTIFVFLFHFFITAAGVAQVKEIETGGFAFEFSLELPGSPEFIFDHISGDIRPWWDHSFSEKPLKLYLEPRPGGRFYEIFDKYGNGALHATVIYADRGKILRFNGPLGLSGNAIDLTCTYQFAQIANDSTRLTLSVHAAGEIQEGWPATVEKVWRHFLIERFEPYINEKYHKK